MNANKLAAKRVTTESDSGERREVVRYWSVYEQRWVTALPGQVPAREYAAMSAADREVADA